MVIAYFRSAVGAMMLVGMALLSACGSESPMAAEAATPSTPPTTTTVTMTPPPVGAAIPASSLMGEVAIADNFDANAWLEAAPIPDVSPDEVGAFRFNCLGGHLNHANNYERTIFC